MAAPDFSAKVSTETLSLSDGTTLEVSKPAGIDDRSWSETKAYFEANPEEARRTEELNKDAKAVRESLMVNSLYDYYSSKLGSGDDVVSSKIMGLEKSPDYAHIFEDIKRAGGQDAVMQHYYNEPLMLKLSRTMGGVPEEIQPVMEKLSSTPMTPQEAAKMGKVSVVESYLSAGNDIEAKDSKGITMMAYAVGANRSSVVKLLMDKKASIAAVDTSGGSALHYAAAYGRKDLCTYLLGQKAEVNKKTVAGQTPLALAIKNKQTGAIDALKAKGGTE
jgi:hypothetical protein